MANFKFRDAYASNGFSANPFAVYALGASEVGSRLMIGRDDQIQLVGTKLHEHGRITCLDGHVGVGKTSLVNVAAYECFQAFLRCDTTQLLIPLVDSFQLSLDADVDEFCEMVFRKVAGGLLAQRHLLSNYELSGKHIEQLAAWLHSPIIQHVNVNMGATVGGSAGISIPGVASIKVNAGVKADQVNSNQINTSSGFNKDGLEQLVRKWLDQIFHVQGNGGVVCIIDNLELLETGPNARRMLEALRDRLFTINGLRWVFCGANGVIHSLAASPRLASFLNMPIIDVKNVATKFIEPLIKARLQEFSLNKGDGEANLPILLDDINRLYPIINYNLRDLLALVDQYCKHQFSINKGHVGPEEKAKRFQKWLEKETADSYKILSGQIAQDAWVVLDIAMSTVFKGVFSVGAYREFSANSKVQITQDSFKRWLKYMVNLGLISKYIDDGMPDEDEKFQRDIYMVTAKGALVHYARLVKNENQSYLPQMDWLRRVHH
jgi:hypothetical protein